jgi:methionyl-tRNA synthetase
LVESCNAALSDQLGNLLSRLLVLIERHCSGRVPAAPTDAAPLALAAAAAAASADAHLDAGEPDRALDDVLRLIRAGNAHVSEREPWKIARELSSELDAARRSALRRELDACLGETARLLCWVAGLLEPFVPDTAREIARCLGCSVPNAYARGPAPRWDDLLRGAWVQPRTALFPRLSPLPR